MGWDAGGWEASAMLECFLYIQFYSAGECALEKEFCVADSVQLRHKVMSFARNSENGADVHVVSGRAFGEIGHASAWCQSEVHGQLRSEFSPASE